MKEALNFIKKSIKIRKRIEKEPERPFQGTGRMELAIWRDFSTTPGGRKRKDGPHSGEAFYEDFLLPAFEKAVKDVWYTLSVNVRDLNGLPAGFIDESFCRLIREKGPKLVQDYLDIRGVTILESSPPSEQQSYKDSKILVKKVIKAMEKEIKHQLKTKN